jgi:hypothetical protein
MLAGVLKQITGQMANMTQNQSYSGTGHKVKEAYDAYSLICLFYFVLYITRTE